MARDVAAQMAAGSALHLRRDGREPPAVAGAQKFSAGKDDPAALDYGQSITDACLGWDDSVAVLETLSAAVEARRTAEGTRAVAAQG